MKELIIGPNDAGQRLDRFLGKAFPNLPASLIQKSIRLKKVKLNGRPSALDARVAVSDRISLYLSDELFAKPQEAGAYKLISSPRLNIIYEDKNIILIDKAPGIGVQPDGRDTVNTLINHLKAYLFKKGEWAPDAEHSFAPALCNRLDRNTGGIVIAAKNSESLRIINQKIKDREIKKLYLCIVHGKMRPENGSLEGFIFKDSKQNRVFVNKSSVRGSKTAVTIYRTLDTRSDLSLLECELVTGRTHQIRAQLADAGHPLLGDGKYGGGDRDKLYGEKYQALYSYKLVFAFKTPAGKLDYLKGAFYKVSDVEFVQKYFG